MNNGALIFIAIAAFFLLAKKEAEDKLTNLFTNVNDGVADSILGEILQLRTVEAKKAADWLKNILWLKNSYRTFLLDPPHSFAARFRIDNLGDYQANNLAKEIINAHITIPGWVQWAAGHSPVAPLVPMSNAQRAVDAIKQIQNIAQALEVGFWYHDITGKNLGAGLQWLPNEAMIEVYNHLHKIGVDKKTGVYNKTTNVQLTNLPRP